MYLIDEKEKDIYIREIFSVIISKKRNNKTTTSKKKWTEY